MLHYGRKPLVEGVFYGEVCGSLVDGYASNGETLCVVLGVADSVSLVVRDLFLCIVHSYFLEDHFA